MKHLFIWILPCWQVRQWSVKLSLHYGIHHESSFSHQRTTNTISALYCHAWHFRHTPTNFFRTEEFLLYLFFVFKSCIWGQTSNFVGFSVKLDIFNKCTACVHEAIIKYLFAGLSMNWINILKSIISTVQKLCTILPYFPCPSYLVFRTYIEIIL